MNSLICSFYIAAILDKVNGSTRVGIENTAQQWFRDANKRLKNYQAKLEKKKQQQKGPTVYDDDSENDRKEDEKSNCRTKKRKAATVSASKMSKKTKQFESRSEVSSIIDSSDDNDA